MQEEEWSIVESPAHEEECESSDSTKSVRRSQQAQNHHSSQQGPSPLLLSSASSHYAAETEKRRRLQQRPRSVALGKAESVLLSSSGDIVVCRCRSSSYPPFNGSPPYQWHEDIALLCCDNECDNLSTQLQDSTICNPWPATRADPRSMRTNRLSSSRGGLLGGAPADVASPLQDDGLLGGSGAVLRHHQDPLNDHGLSPENNPDFVNRAQRAFRSPPLPGAASFDEDSIAPIQSFDYSHFFDGGNDMIPTPHRLEPTVYDEPENYPPIPRPPSPEVLLDTDKGPKEAPRLPHGVPSFLPAFSQVLITQVSAHPLGSHVLLISDAGLLFSYGLNDYGQLGIGLKTHVRGYHRGYVMSPTIVTPLVENGGKAYSCAAGISHSLVVVVTEERRLVRSQSFDSGSTRKNGIPDAIVHHQLYGFGRNDYMKIGLVSPKLAKAGAPDEMEHVVLPRRVALRCRVRPEPQLHSCHRSVSGDGSTASPSPSAAAYGGSPPPQGIFAIAASAEHSAALVRRASGDVELYTWGNASFGALGLPQASSSSSAVSPSAAVEMHDFDDEDGMGGGPVRNSGSPIPHTVHVVPVPSFVASLSLTSNPAARPASLLNDREYEHPVSLALGRRCSFVTTSTGRCFSFGLSEDGMLGLGEGITEAHRPSEITIPDPLDNESIVSVSAGASHVLALTDQQRVYAWGTCQCAGLQSPMASSWGGGSAPEAAPPTTPLRSLVSQQAVLASHSPRSHATERAAPRPEIQWLPRRLETTYSFAIQQQQESDKIVEVCAGFDCSFVVTESGRVMSCGKKSGRLGLGEIDQDAKTPQPLFGGLRLWQRKPTARPQTATGNVGFSWAAQTTPKASASGRKNGQIHHSNERERQNNRYAQKRDDRNSKNIQRSNAFEANRSGSSRKPTLTRGYSIA